MAADWNLGVTALLVIASTRWLGPLFFMISAEPQAPQLARNARLEQTRPPDADRRSLPPTSECSAALRTKAQRARRARHRPTVFRPRQQATRHAPRTGRARMRAFFGALTQRSATGASRR